MNRNTIESTLYDIHNNQSNNDHILMVQPLKYHDMYMYLRNILIDKLIYFDLLPCNNECEAASFLRKGIKYEIFIYLVVTLKSLKRYKQDSWYLPILFNNLT